MDSPRRSRNRAACQRCQKRKIRCDGSLPQCSHCVKAHVTCVNEGKQEVNRTYIANLQRRVQSLEALLKETNPKRSREQLGSDFQSSLNEDSQVESFVEDHSRHFEDSSPIQCDPPTTAYVDPGPSQQTVTSTHLRNGQSIRASTNAQESREEPRPAHEIGLVSLSGGEPRYIGPSSGYFLANLIFSSAGRRTGASEGRRGTSDPISLSAGLFNSPASLPNHKEDAIELSSKYFQTVHLIYPFLHEVSHMQRLETMYISEKSTPVPAIAFQVYMVLAIAASDLSRRFRVRLPAEGYYTAATQYFGGACAEGSLEGLQCLLLLMVYALHNPSCGVNIWSLNYQCLGALIDLGLQRDVRTSSSFPISFLEQEMRTRIFWVVYSFDRTLGTMMGRPIGVRDEACELRLPSDVTDQHLQSTAQERPDDNTPSHMTYSIHLFKLARMNSEIKYVMHSICRDSPAYAYPPVADIHQWQRDMIDRLKSWLLEIPNASGMASISKICETKYHEMMILLLRPSPGIPEPSDELFAQCFQHAVDMIRGFGELYRQEALLYSRLVVHSIFLGTLIMLHCLWKLPRIAALAQIDDVVSDTSISLNILSSIGEYWTEAKRARDCIHEISGATVQRLVRGRGLDSIQSTGKMSSAASGRRTQAQNTHVEVIDQPLNQPDSAIEISQMDDMAGYDFNVDTMDLFNDNLPNGFMDFAGAPDFDSLMWEVFNST